MHSDLQSAKFSILTICGSTRSNSSNHVILHDIAMRFAGEIDFVHYEKIDRLPHFNPDLDKTDPPAAVAELRGLVENADGVIICTPEYVFSLPGSLKNALEWTVSTTLFTDKPVALIVASSLGEKAFESLQLVMKTLGAVFNEGTVLHISGARVRTNEPETIDAINNLVVSLTSLLRDP